MPRCRIIEYGNSRPAWADDKFGEWLTANCSQDNAFPVIMPQQLCINGAVWIREQFRQRVMLEPNEETAREMFGSLVAIHMSSQVTQQDIFTQIFESYMCNLPAKG